MPGYFELYNLKLSDTVIGQTRKPHECVICRKPIEVGSRAHKMVYINDDRKFCSDYYHGYICPDEEEGN